MVRERAGLPPAPDFLANADDTIRDHWVSAGAPWKPGCDRCTTEDEKCPVLKGAEDLVDGMLWLSSRGRAR